MRKKILFGLLCVIIPLFLFTGLYISNILLQPKPFSMGVADNTPTEAYVDPGKNYYLTGVMECYPKVTASPANLDNYSSSMMYIDSLADIRSEECRHGDNYIATIRFFIDAPGEQNYSILFPGEFCEYIFFINRRTPAYSGTLRANIPIYPSPKVIDFPYSDDGKYEVIIYIITPTTSSGSTNATVLFGTTERINHIRNWALTTTIVILAAMLATIMFSFTQYIAMKNERILTSFILLAFAFMARTLMVDDVIIMSIIPSLPYQMGTVYRSLTMPFLLLAIVNHEYSMFPGFFPKKFTYWIGAFQIIPLINALTLDAYPALNIASYVAFAVPYALCIYVFIRAHMAKVPYNYLFGLGLMQSVAAAACEYVCKNMVMPARYTLIYSFLTFAIIEMVLLAKKYANQYESEEYYTSELHKTLEAMQASENAFLNAQMKPHFLYNTLNTIADLCVTDPNKAKSLINSLKDYCNLILSIDNMDRTVPLAREMELVNAYTSIEKERFPSINFYTDFPIRMPRIEMPPLVLQPLIENAIKHGVRKSDKPGVITLRIRDTMDSVTFYVSDNGVGMDAEKMEMLFEEPKENKSIGVYNIDTRLKNLYGDGLTVDSTIGLGTCVSFSIPK